MTISAGNAHRLLRRSAVTTVLLSAGIICVSYAADRDPRDAALPGKIPEAIQKVVAYDKAGKKADKPYRIAYISEGGGNSYANARDKGLDDASKKYGFTVKAFDAHFNPQNQLKDVQNAVQEKFDGYLFAPATDAASCKMWKDFLVPTKKPVVSLDLTMCGDVTYTPGLAATVTMQSQPYYDFHVEQAFAAACEGRNPCKGVSLSGFAGSDLFARWDKAIENGLKKYPNVQMVSRREAKFDARIAEQITQDALQVNRDLAFVVSHYDDMSVGAVAAIKAAGLVPGKDVKIYSVVANSLGLQQIRDGVYNETTMLLPYEETYYAAVALMMALDGQPVNAYINLADLPVVTDGPGTILITKANADKFKPNW
jgi:ABC-type sugar transport system substrate-binding protein